MTSPQGQGNGLSGLRGGNGHVSVRVESLSLAWWSVKSVPKHLAHQCVRFDRTICSDNHVRPRRQRSSTGCRRGAPWWSGSVLVRLSSPDRGLRG